MEKNQHSPEEDFLYEDPNQAPIEIKEKKKDENRPLWKVILFDYVSIIVVAFLIALFLTTFVIINCRIPSQSMEATIMTGDRVIGSRLTYVFGEPKRGDIAVFKAPQAALDIAHKNEKYGDVLYIKRVVALPGETIEVKKSRVYINGSPTPLDEPYLSDKDLRDCGSLYNMSPYTLKDDEYFMMGDNRDNSLDSRAWGPVPKSEILAKALFTYWPLSNITWLATSYEYDVTANK